MHECGVDVVTHEEEQTPSAANFQAGTGSSIEVINRGLVENVAFQTGLET